MPNSSVMSPGWPRPDNTAMGASTHGVRTPPRPIPSVVAYESTRAVGVESLGRGRRVAVAHPPVERVERALQHEVHLRPGVDRNLRRYAGCVGTRDERGELLDREGARSRRRRRTRNTCRSARRRRPPTAGTARCRVGGPGGTPSLPNTSVSLCTTITGTRGSSRIWSRPARRRRRASLSAGSKRSKVQPSIGAAGAGTTLQQEPVDCGRVHIDRVDIGREVERRLRRARRDHSVERDAVTLGQRLADRAARPA